jgi:hypothetical protein
VDVPAVAPAAELDVPPSAPAVDQDEYVSLFSDELYAGGD